MKDNFEFFGIKAKKRRNLVKHLTKKQNRPPYTHLSEVVTKLWILPEREYQYFAQELTEKYASEFHSEIISMLEKMIVNKSWWDSVDFIAKKLTGPYFLKFPNKKQEFLPDWIKSENIWLQRCCLLFQLSYKQKTDINLLFNFIHQLKHKDDFFIRKAIGWALRAYSKIDPKLIYNFINETELSSLSKKEGLKHIKKYNLISM